MESKINIPGKCVKFILPRISPYIPQEISMRIHRISQRRICPIPAGFAEKTKAGVSAGSPAKFLRTFLREIPVSGVCGEIIEVIPKGEQFLRKF